MRISDWSSDVCSSDLDVTGGCHAGAAAQHELAGHELAVVFADRAGCRLEAWIRRERAARPLPDLAVHLLQSADVACRLRPQAAGLDEIAADRDAVCEIGRASCRERVCQYV